MATVPLSGTNIRLVSGVPFNSDYKHSRWFDTLDAQTAWMQALPVVYTASNHNYQRKSGKTYLSVKKSIDDLWGTNYLMFQNTSYNNKWFYAFVTDLEYVQNNTTYVYFEIDVLQSWMFDFNFKPSYVIREHMPLWNTDNTPVIHHQDEGLDYGNEYDVVDVQQFQPYNGVYFLVIVSKSPMHTNSADLVTANTIKAIYNGGVTPLNYYVHPFRLDGSNPSVSLGSISSIISLLQAIYSNADSVNNVVSLYVSDYLGMDLPYDTTTNTVTMDSTFFDLATITDASNTSFTTVYFKGIDYYTPKTVDFGAKYTGFNSVTESKLNMFPYCMISLEDFRGNRADFKPEYISDTNVKVTVRGSMGVSNKVAYTIDAYNTSGLSSANAQTVSLEQGLIDNNPNDVPIITDLLSAYLQGNRNSLNTQKESIAVNGVLNGIGAGIGMVASGLSGNVVGAVSSGVSGVGGAANSILQLQAINSKQQDINNTPPGLVKMGANASFDYGNGYQGVYIVKRQIKQEYIDKLTDFFNMYGYKSNRVKVPNLHTRVSWNYVQTQDAFITGNFNNEDEQDIRKVFDNGITLWHVDDVGNYSLSNGVTA